jgi:hypothetical protein
MLLMEVISVFCQKNMKHVNILCGVKQSVFSVISDFRRSINKIAMFLDLMQRRMLLASYRSFGTIYW